MPRIVAYHPEILVERGLELYKIELDLDDFYSNEEVMAKLVAETGGRTVGEIVGAIERGELKKRDNSILSARIVKVAGKAGRGNVRQWGEKVN